MEQLLQVKNVTKINEFARVFQENVETDLSMQNIFWFGQQAIMGGLSMDNVNFMSLPNQGVKVYSRTYGNTQSYVTPIPDELLETVNTYFNPYLEDIQLEELDLMSVNSDGTLSSSRGVVEDTKANQPRPTPTPEPLESEDPEVTESPAPGASTQPAESPAPGESTSPEPAPTPGQSSAGESPAPEPTPETVPTPTPAPTPENTPSDIEYGPGMEPVA